MSIVVYSVEGGTETKIATVSGLFERERGDYFYPVTITAPEEGLTVESDGDQAKEGGSYSFTITLNEENIHNGLELKVNGRTAAFTEINTEKGTYTYTADNVQGELSFEITMYNNFKIEIDAPEDGLTVLVDPKDEWVREGSALTLTVTLDEEHLKDNVALKVNDEAVEFTNVNADNGVYTYSVASVANDLAFEVIRTFNYIATIDAPEEGVLIITDPEDGIIEEGKDYTVIVQLHRDYLDYDVKMSVNGAFVELTPDEEREDLFSYVVKSVTEDISIVVTIENLSSIGSIDTRDVNFYTANNTLTVVSTVATDISIYTLSGSVKYQRVVEGAEQFALPAGVYILKAGDKAAKVVVTK